MQKQRNTTGFTLVELLVSVGISAVLMVGMAAFFSSTFRNMFESRGKVSNNQEQFVVSSILHQKLSGIEGMQVLDSGNEYVVLQNKQTEETPFTYIGLSDSGDRLIFKDFFIFNGRQGNNSSSSYNLENPAGITRNATSGFIATPLENEIKICANTTTCSALGLNGSYTDLNHPTDVFFEGTSNLLYITDSGNGRIISVDFNDSQRTDLVIENLDFPTGIAHHNNGTDDFLFFSESHKNRVRRVNLNTGQTKTVAGSGSDESCNNTNAEFCQLSFPTGLHIEGNTLYIADTGNNRVLRIEEPSTDFTDFSLELSLDSDTQVSQISFTFPEGGNVSSVVEGVSGNQLRSGAVNSMIQAVSNVITYSFESEIGNPNTEQVGCPESCVDYFNGFDVTTENNIFMAGDEIEIDGTTHEIESVIGNTVILEDPHPIIPNNGDIARITSEYNGTFNFHFDLSLATNLPGGYQVINIEALDENSNTIPSSVSSSFITLSNPSIGSEEDIVFENTTGTGYVTGLGWSGGSLQINDSIEFDTPFIESDYESEFEIRNLNIDTLNGGRLLNIQFEALESGSTAEGTDEWKAHQFKASLN